MLEIPCMMFTHTKIETCPKKLLIVIDEQVDFNTGSLGTKEAVAIIPNVTKKIKNYLNNKDSVAFTYDTHYSNYFGTLEGNKLPVEHCIHGTEGWELIPEIQDIITNNLTQENDIYEIEKKTFGYTDWNKIINEIDEIEIIGLCTDICVVSNALIIRALFPNMKITVDASCCAGVTPEKHKAALEVMKSCQIDVINE